MEIFFALFILCGFSSEANIIQREVTPTDKVPLWINTIYLLGSVWFLFWKEPYIIHGFMEALMMISFIKAIISYTGEWKPKYQFIDSVFSLILICLMGLHFVVYLIH
jgi:hypothetical protein